MLPVAIGPFQIVRELGRGGMGVVYLATDSKLDRQVAIKALPADLAADPDRLARFQREAKVLASLNHPNVGGIYGLEVTDGHQYLILEFIEGQTLADRLEQGAIPVNEALTLARQIAEALEAAHEKGIVHRDLKPGNVMVSPDGMVKVLDFGLARTGDGSPSSTSAALIADSPTVTSPAVRHSPTIPGAIMGTAGYMSPEQARGRVVDKRSDIFSFGCVLYEMLTGAGPFPGETVTDALGAILHREPAWTLLPPGTPQRVRELLTSCLAKDRRQRLHDIGDARLELERAISGNDIASAAPVPPRASSRLATGVAILLGAAGLIGGTWWAASRTSVRTAAKPIVARMLLPSQTQDYYQANDALLSPDGRSVLFSARSVEDSKYSLWVRPLDSFDARPLQGTTDAGGLCWSPDGRSVAFVADGKVWAIDVDQRGARRLINGVAGYGGVDWGADGSFLISNYSNGTTKVSPVLRIPPGGATPEPLTRIEPDSLERVHVFPRFLPDGQHFLYVGVIFDPASEVRSGRLYAGRIGSTEQTFLTNMISSVWYADPGWLVYVEDGTVKALPFDAAALKITGPAITIADGVRYFRGYGSSSLSVSRNGTIAYQPVGEDQQMVWIDLEGKPTGTLGPKGLLNAPRISRDGSLVAVELRDRRTGYSDIWLYATARSTSKRLTSDAREESQPVWSRDDTRIYFSADRRAEPDVFSILADGSGPIDEVYGPGSDGIIWYAQDVSPDGTSLIVGGTAPKLARDLRILPLGKKAEALPFQSSAANEYNAHFSPDGRWILYASDESGKDQIYLAPFPGPGSKVQLSENGGYNPIWAPDGGKVYFSKPTASEGTRDEVLGPTVLYVVDLATPEAYKSPPKPRVQFETLQQLNISDIAPDGKRFIAVTEPRETPPIHVILNGLPPRP